MAARPVAAQPLYFGASASSVHDAVAPDCSGRFDQEK
jgi:hypothetical protein